ncbi:MAG: twin-arginine translocase TatA/TatE family subunit [Cyanobacteria bacterium J06621_15]
MFGLGFPEMAVIAFVAILIFGPKKIPELGSALGKTLRGFKDEMKNDNDTMKLITKTTNNNDNIP